MQNKGDLDRCKLRRDQASTDTVEQSSGSGTYFTSVGLRAQKQASRRSPSIET